VDRSTSKGARRAAVTRDVRSEPYDGAVLAINGFLEWFFLMLLTFLVIAVTVFGLFVAIQFFRNPGRRVRHSRR
jgi:hypothetical protein